MVEPLKPITLPCRWQQHHDLDEGTVIVDVFVPLDGADEEGPWVFCGELHFDARLWPHIKGMARRGGFLVEDSDQQGEE